MRVREEGSNQPEISFARDIRALFRQSDIDAMRPFFSLELYEDVSAHADDILTRVDGGSMPCDVMWSDEEVDQLRAWINLGCPR